MTCEIIFSATIKVSGVDIRSIRNKFDNMSLFHPSIEQICEFRDIELVTGVDDDSYDDFTSEYNHAYDKR